MSDILTHVDVAFDSEGKKINFNLLWDDSFTHIRETEPKTLQSRRRPFILSFSLNNTGCYVNSALETNKSLQHRKKKPDTALASMSDKTNTEVTFSLRGK